MKKKYLLSMKTLHYARHSLARTLIRQPRLTYKEFNELRFWGKEIRPIIDWYLGKIPHYWNILAPTDDSKVTDFDVKRNAILTWAKASLDYYPNHLLLPTNYFAGSVILDIGCGPIPHAQAFTGCQIYNLDPLLDEYRKLGFPLELHSPRSIFVSSRAEKTPFETGYFDAVISVNAIDHVDDLRAVAREMARVLKPGGILRFEAHYHRATMLEPWSLCDETILRHFAPLGIKKIQERPYNELDPDSATEKGEVLAIWANKV
jgi:SAM-dependent methyltransferase